MDRTKRAHRQLKELGCFHKVHCIIDTIDDDNSNENKDRGFKDLEVVFKVEELAPTYVDAKTYTGDNEVVGHLRAGVPNALGRGERFEISYHRGTAGFSEIKTEFRQPLHRQIWSNTKAILEPGCRSFVKATVLNRFNPRPAAGLDLEQNVVSVSADLSPKDFLKQTVKMELSWRNVMASSTEVVGFPARSFCGHSLKSSLLHQLSYNTRDDDALPTKGSHGVFRQELAGLVPIGNVAYFKTLLSFTKMHWVSSRLSVGASFGAGFLLPITSSSDALSSLDSNPVDRFTLGGPMMFRGFANHKLGRKDEGNHLGGYGFWRTALHCYFSLPFLRGHHWLSQNVRGHIFGEAGSITNSPKTMAKMLRDHDLRTPRLSIGGGLAIKLGDVGRAELNYCLPLSYLRGHDQITNQGLQFGIGVECS